MKIVIQTEDFDVSTELELLRHGLPGIGGINLFVGTVRDSHLGDEVAAMELEHYPGMTEKSLQDIVDQAKSRWDVLNSTIIHRVGKLYPTDQIVLVAVASTHRSDAYAACEFIMDFLKTSAPFWKKEYTPDGARWVDARISDEERLMKWRK
ncbi:molybdopterin converting factor subunit 2 [Polynucleobacter sp. SHI8]|uniref:molybdopterin synthase catalytic subunit MoaE n=1 Tax=unclassified Polynucleobacter TaxID=2640945 RepID=UPI0024930CEC|nr:MULTISPECIES: molybdopterin synthase catalytic subunit MoaE [unclassified Polynucleobacter]BDW10775.1 molybdopterin converting factor subunit 2 [Polynucleobacter sp. SHI2]BDW13221.1 molybdopterin converting factor subunit 2 [Polynucleobacter sp. SHI8]